MGPDFSLQPAGWIIDPTCCLYAYALQQIKPAAKNLRNMDHRIWISLEPHSGAGAPLLDQIPLEP